VGLFSIASHRPGSDPGKLVTWLGIWSDLVLVVVKIAAGLLGRSQALLADGIHSLSDLVTDFITLLALGLGRKPRDREHHYGHGKIEDLAALGVGMILIAIAVFMAIHAVTAWRAGLFPERSVWLIVAAMFSLLVKGWLARITRRVGQELKSPSLLSNAAHHRSDALSSLATVIGVGLFLIVPRFTWADMASAILVSLFIVHAGAVIVIQAGRDLVDTSPPEEQMAEIRLFIGEIPGVRRVGLLRGRLYAMRLALDLDIEVESTLSVQQGHEISQRVEELLLDRFGEILAVMVHVEPFEEPSS
jgi:cation diffusion facilitator family transporter